MEGGIIPEAILTPSSGGPTMLFISFCKLRAKESALSTFIGYSLERCFAILAKMISICSADASGSMWTCTSICKARLFVAELTDCLLSFDGLGLTLSPELIRAFGAVSITEVSLVSLSLLKSASFVRAKKVDTIFRTASEPSLEFAMKAARTSTVLALNARG